jgi:hypothetical protein
MATANLEILVAISVFGRRQNVSSLYQALSNMRGSRWNVDNISSQSRDMTASDLAVTIPVSGRRSTFRNFGVLSCELGMIEYVHWGSH